MLKVVALPVIHIAVWKNSPTEKNLLENQIGLPKTKVKKKM